MWNAEEALKMKGNNILKLSWPIFVELLLQMLVGNADQIMVGWRDPNGVGAIGNANQITNLLLLVFSVVCTAAMILISQYIGAKDTKRVNQTYTVALLMNLVFGLLVSAVLVLGCGPIFRLMGVHALIFEETCLYMQPHWAGYDVPGGLPHIYCLFPQQPDDEGDHGDLRGDELSEHRRKPMCSSTAWAPFRPWGSRVPPSPAVCPGSWVRPSSPCSSAEPLGQSSHCVASGPFPGTSLNGLLAIGVPTGGESVSYNGSQICIQTVCNRFAAYVVNTRVYANLFANVTICSAQLCHRPARSLWRGSWAQARLPRRTGT